MGVVHLGESPEGRRVAVKVLRPHVVGDDEARERLAREVSSLTRVRSNRVAEIVDADPWGPIPYVATRYVPGLNLSDHVREEGPITGDDLLHFARGLAEALHAVHRVGVLHRDVKPSNVLMEGRNPVLIDFGLARVADDIRLTRTGWLLGTPGYLAPEVLHGDEPAPSADVYSWAATVAFAGMGRPPFGEGHALAVMDRVRRGELDLTGLGYEVLGPVTAALDPDPAHRPTLSALVGSLGGSPTVPRERRTDPPTVTMPIAASPDFRATTREAIDLTREAEPAPATRLDPTTRPDPTAAPATRLDPTAAPYQQPPPPVTRTPWSQRLRRWVLGAGLLGVVTGAVAAAPYLACVALTCLVLLLRGLSLTVTGANQRRLRRGPKWYDGVVTVLVAPWHFVQSSLGSLLLLAWAAMLAGCVGLVLLVVGVPTEAVLAASGCTLGVSLWTGPGGSRVRAPVQVLGFPLARKPVPWAVAALVLLGVAAALLLVAGQGADWTPGAEAPWDGTWFDER